MAKKDILLLLFVVIIWGTSFPIIKLGLLTLDPFILMALRFLFCAIPFVFFIKKPNVPLLYIAIYGIIFGVGLWGMVSLGIYFGLSAGIASLLLQMSVFLTIFLAAVLLNETIHISKKVAFVIALFGVVLIMSVTDGSVTVMGVFLLLVAAFSMSLTNVFIKKVKVENLFSFMIWTSLFSPIPLFLIAYLTSGIEVFQITTELFNIETIFSIFFQAYPITLFGYWVWNSLINKYPISTIAPFGLLVPVSGLISSYFMFNETIGIIKLFASLLILIALIINIYGERTNL